MPSQHLVSSVHKFDTINLFVGNLSLDTTEIELNEEFVSYGAILSTRIMNDRYIGSRQPQGYGFVSMAIRAEGEAAITGVNGKKIRDHMVSVIEALPMSRIDSSTATGNYRHRQ
jgi:cold-inducible RNA-binding protein